MDIIMEAIEKAGYKPGKDIAIALDSAASSFSTDLTSSYDLTWSGGGKMNSDELVAMAESWVKKYPIVSWEDPLAEKDWAGFKKLTASVGNAIKIVGDDLFVTNTQYIARGIEEKSANSVLI
jgi:enolase